MKTLLPFLLATLIISCNPFISKDLRQKNRCNRKLERTIKKCPDLLKTDTIEKIVEIEVPKLEIKDSIILKVEIDSFTVDSLLNYINTLKTQKERIKTFTKYVLQSFKLDTTITNSAYSLTFKIKNGVFSHNIVINEQKIKKPIQIEQKTVSKIELTLWEQLLNALGELWWIVLIFTIGSFILLKMMK